MHLTALENSIQKAQQNQETHKTEWHISASGLFW